MNVMLARHGNTFEANEPAYYVGSQHDLPLVALGLEQAKAIGLTLKQQGVDLAGVYTGPLQRMRSTAQVALRAMNSPLQEVVDERLNELDYGLWSGLTSQEVRWRFGNADYEAWERQSRWPQLGEWRESEDMVITRIHEFAHDLLSLHAADDQILVVASNGCLRYFLTLIPGAFEHQVAEQQLKIGTGHLCQLQYLNNVWSLNYWNQKPASLGTYFGHDP